MNTATRSAFSGISADASIIVTSVDHDGFTTVFGTVYNWPFSVKRENYGDAIQAAIRRALEAGDKHEPAIMEAFEQMVVDRAKDPK